MRVSVEQPETFLRELFDTTVRAAGPARALGHFLDDINGRDALVIGAGKAAASMAAALEARWTGGLRGLVAAPYGHVESCSHIEVVEAAHPVPDDQGERFARRVLEAVRGLTPDDLLICLLSGGGSALLALPAPGLTLADKQSVNRQLLRSGAPIDEINCVRKHLSAIKGGRLAAACHPAELVTFAISDVPGDDPTVIASGPTVPDPTTCADALAILQRRAIAAPAAVVDWLRDPAAETPKVDDAIFSDSRFHLIATPDSALRAAADAAAAAGVEVIYLGDAVEGEARAVGTEQAALAQEHLAAGRRCLLLSGGETTVTVRGSGRGGRNTEFLLALACALQGAPGIHALAADTDGIDGAGDNAGAVLGPATWTRAQALGLDARAMLENNDGYRFFAALDDLVVTGPTRTNVNDFRALLVLP